jgi:hypothetical protein
MENVEFDMEKRASLDDHACNFETSYKTFP